MANYVNISKLDAAKRQLEMGIRLFLSNEDIVSIHTLVAAAHQILTDISNKQGKKSNLKNTMLEMLKPEKRKEFLIMIKDPENFFKHANKDPDGILKFYFESTEMLIWDLCTMYQQLTNEVTPLIRVYYLWYFSKYTNQIADTPEGIEYKNLILELNLDPSNRYQFLEYLTHIQKVK